jgi:inhibitor of cysteine peptidase
MPYYNYAPSTSVLVYDIADPVHPVLASNVTVSGYIVGARMIGQEVFVVTTHNIYLDGDKLNLPTLTVNGSARAVAATDIGYFPEAQNSTSLTEVLLVNLTAPERATLTTLLADPGWTMYVSFDSIYLAGYAGSFNTVNGTWVDATAIHRLFVWNGAVACAVTGTVLGHILNSYAMDEFNGDLRVATTQWAADGRQTANHLFVLDRSLKLVGQLDDLAPGETIQSVRFISERGYVVTFRQIDPFFVIDLANRAAPRVLGELKATGFSRFLLPVGENLIVGIGPETSAPDASNRTQTIGLKLSLYDVSDVSSPRVLSTYVITGSYVYSSGEWDPHAILWTPSRNLLALPIEIYNYDAGRGWDTSTYWTGVYVFNVTAQGGVALQGKITLAASVSSTTPSPYYYGSSLRRTLQVGDYLYSLSDTTVQVNDIATLDLVAHATYWTAPAITPGPMMGGAGGSVPPTK